MCASFLVNDQMHVSGLISHKNNIHILLYIYLHASEHMDHDFIGLSHSLMKQLNYTWKQLK